MRTTIPMMFNEHRHIEGEILANRKLAAADNGMI